MRRFTKLLGKGLKYVAYVGVGSFGLSMAYLKYINSQVGEIYMNKDILVKYYMENEKMEEK